MLALERAIMLHQMQFRSFFAVMCAMHGAAAALNDSNPDSIRSQVAVAVRAACRPGLFPASACVVQPHTPIVQVFEYRSCAGTGCMGDFVAGGDTGRAAAGRRLRDRVV